MPKSAKALVDAGFRSLTDLAGVTRHQLLEIPGIGAATVETLEEVAGAPFPRERPARKPPRPTPLGAEELWRRRGLSFSAAITFVQVGMTLERLKTTTREELLSLSGVGVGAVRACELILGRALPAREESRGRG